jgi:hypothetical protein
MAEAWSDFLSAWENWRVEVDEYRQLDGERVLVLYDFSGRGKASGLEAGQVRRKGANLLYIHGGKVTQLVVYFDLEHALADLGLPSGAGSPGS